MKKNGVVSLVAGIILLVFGVWMLDSSGPFSYLGYSSGMRTIMEFAPWFFLTLGALGVIGAIFYFIQDSKPIIEKQIKIIEKNGLSVVAELENGTRETLILNNTVVLVVGDVGIAGCKGSIIIKFNKL